MRRFRGPAAAAILILALAGSAAAEPAWAPLMANANATVSWRNMGPSPPDAKLVRVQVRGEFNAAQDVQGMPVRTQQNVYDINCTTRQLKRVQTIISTEPALGGQQRKEDYAAEPWRQPTAGDSVSAQIVARACTPAAPAS